MARKPTSTAAAGRAGRALMARTAKSTATARRAVSARPRRRNAPPSAPTAPRTVRRPTPIAAVAPARGAGMARTATPTGTVEAGSPARPPAAEAPPASDPGRVAEAPGGRLLVSRRDRDGLRHDAGSHRRRCHRRQAAGGADRELPDHADRIDGVGDVDVVAGGVDSDPTRVVHIRRADGDARRVERRQGSAVADRE